MANKTIFELPEQTGKTNDDVLAIVNSGNTTTSKIKVSTLVSGVAGFVDGISAQTLVNKYLPTSGATITGTTYVDKLYMSGNTIGFRRNFNIGGDTAYPNSFTDSGRGAGGVIGGARNTYNTSNSVWGYGIIIGGDENTISSHSPQGVIIGGGLNLLNGASDCVHLGGGWSTTNGSSRWSAVIGGFNSDITGTGTFAIMLGCYDSTMASSATGNNLLGGFGNTISGNATYSTILNGTNQTIASSNYSVIAGGQYAEITGSSSYSFTSGGQSNRVYSSTHAASVCGASNEVRATSNFSGIFVGQTNTISGATHAAIVGGTNHSNRGNRSVIVGGSGNTITHERSVILGGSGLTSNEAAEVLVQNLKISGQTSGNFHDNGSGSTQTIDWNEGNLQRINLTANTSITLTNLKPGGTYMLYMNNGGSHSISSVSATGYTFKYETNGLPTITHNSTDLFIFDVFGTDTCYVRYHADFG